MAHYDIFISYRREGGAQYARILQLMLIQRGYRVFLDYDELKDGIFTEKIQAAIKDAPVFMLVLSKGSMARCVNDGDWVRREIMLAVEQQKHIVPVNPDNSFDGFPADVPEAIREAVGSHQYSEISFGQALGVTTDLMIANRLAPTLGQRAAQHHKDEDMDAAKASLAKIERHQRFVRRLAIACAVVVAAMVLGTCCWFWNHQREKEALDTMRTELHEKYKDFHLLLNTDLTMAQMAVIDTLLTNMVPVYPDSIWMSQFEFTQGQWHTLKGEPCDPSQAHMPMTNVSYGDIYMLLGQLTDMTNLIVELPGEDVWDYAAHGGEHHETTRYAGDDDADRVAWYQGNAGGHAHPSDGQQGKEPNRLDLYDMSGNVSELCNTPFAAEQDNVPFTLCGGNFKSPASAVTIAARAPFDTNAKADTVGFRIIIRKD